jgi:hypothetical protein
MAWYFGIVIQNFFGIEQQYIFNNWLRDGKRVYFGSLSVAYGKELRLAWDWV